LDRIERVDRNNTRLFL